LTEPNLDDIPLVEVAESDAAARIVHGLDRDRA
jgi:hypothetical protein